MIFSNRNESLLNVPREDLREINYLKQRDKPLFRIASASFEFRSNDIDQSQLRQTHAHKK